MTFEQFKFLFPTLVAKNLGHGLFIAMDPKGFGFIEYDPDSSECWGYYELNEEPLFFDHIKDLREECFFL